MVFFLTWQHWLVVISTCLFAYGGWAYIRDTLAGRSKPNRVTWGMWALAPLIGTGAALYAGADPWAVARVFLAGFLPLCVFLASFVNKQSYWKLDMFDILCGIFSLAALGAWWLADSPNTAILFAAIGDGFAALPTVRKAWAHPETETGTAFVMSLLASILMLPAIPVWDIQNSAFQIYLLAANTVLIVAVYRKQLFK
ncbi:MAG: hypothetical protein V4474_04460 [Patescibacteria group bacterium]